jgi:hypothetical protein
MTNARKARERRRAAQYRMPPAQRTDAAMAAADMPGQHLWVMTAAWRLTDPEKAYAATMTPEFDEENAYLLDQENILALAGPGCYKCEELYSPTLAALPCRGQLHRADAPVMDQRYYAEKYPGIWDDKLEGFRVLAFPDGWGWVDISFINTHSIRVGTVRRELPGLYHDVWLYDDFEVALAAVYTWAAVGQLRGEPYGWIRHPSSGRRRIDGDYAQQHYQP